MPTDYRNQSGRVDRIRTTLLVTLACAHPMLAAGTALAAPCSFEVQGEGRVAAVIDARSFRLTDGREINSLGMDFTDGPQGFSFVAHWLPR